MLSNTLHALEIDFDVSYTSYTVGEGRQNVGLSSPLRCESFRSLRTKQNTINKIRVKRRLGNEGKGRKKENVRTAYRRKRKVAEIFLIVGRRRRAPTWDPDSRPESEPKTRSPQRQSLPRPSPVRASAKPITRDSKPQPRTNQRTRDRPTNWSQGPNPCWRSKPCLSLNPLNPTINPWPTEINCGPTAEFSPDPQLQPDNPRLNPRPPAHALPPDCAVVSFWRKNSSARGGFPAPRGLFGSGNPFLTCSLPFRPSGTWIRPLLS